MESGIFLVQCSDCGKDKFMTTIGQDTLCAKCGSGKWNFIDWSKRHKLTEERLKKNKKD